MPQMGSIIGWWVPLHEVLKILRTHQSSPEIPFSSLELVFVDLAARVALANNLKGRIRRSFSTFAEEPPNRHDQANDENYPEKKHHCHHRESPTPPPHRVHIPVPFVEALLRDQRTGSVKRICDRMPKFAVHGRLLRID